MKKVEKIENCNCRENENAVEDWDIWGGICVLTQ